MKVRKSIGMITAAALALSLTACSNPITVTFDAKRPWNDGAGSYERLEYSVAVYDTSKGTSEEKRVKIAEGALVYALEENTRTEGAAGYSTLDTDFSVTYNDSAAEADRGKTDTIESFLEFHTDSLAASRMTKTVALAERDGKEDLSYSLEADYFGTHKATRTMNGKTKTLNIPQNTYCDNEAMIFLARATGISKGGTANFYLCNIFDSFLNGSLTNYTMAASADGSFTNVRMDWIEPLVVVEEDKKDEKAAADAPEGYFLPCYRVNISISAEKHGPPYCVYYSSKDIKSNDKTHKKLPVKITYAEYTGSKQARLTEYTLTSLSFAK